MKTKILVILVVAIAFAACGRSSRHHSEVSNSDSIQAPVRDSIVVKTADISTDSLFYKEVYNKKGLVFSNWKDSIVIKTIGESDVQYKVPVLIQRGETENYCFYFETTNEKWIDESENQGLAIHYKLKGIPASGKTLAEDQQIQQKYDWQYLSEDYKSKLNSLLYQQIKYPKKQFIYK